MKLLFFFLFSHALFAQTDSLCTRYQEYYCSQTTNIFGNADLYSFLDFWAACPDCAAQIKTLKLEAIYNNPDFDKKRFIQGLHQLTQVEKFIFTSSDHQLLLDSLLPMPSLKSLILSYLNVPKDSTFAPNMRFLATNTIEYLQISFYPIQRIKLALDSIDTRQFPNLKTLSLRTTGITSIPKAVFRLKTIQNLDVSFNPLTSVVIPQQALPQLQTLDVGFTSIHKTVLLKRFLVNCPALEKLFLPRCAISKIPKNIYKLRTLKTLEIGSNPLLSGEMEKCRKALPNTKVY